MQHRNDRAEEQQIEQIILNSDPKVLLQRLSQTLGEIFQVNCCTVTTISDSYQPTQTAAWYDNYPAGLPQHQVSLSEALTKVMQVVEPLAIDDVRIDMEKEWQHSLIPVRAVLAIATQFQGKTNGIITLIRTQPSQWDELDKERLKFMAAPVAIAISQTVQTTRIAALQQQVHTYTQYQSLVDRLTKANCSCSDLNQIFHLAAAGTAKVLQVDRGSILMLKYAEPLFKSRERSEQVLKAKATVVYEWLNPQSSRLGTAALPSGHSSPPVWAQQPSAPSTPTYLNQSFWLSDCVLCQQALMSKPVVIANRSDLPELDPATDIAPLFNFTFLPALLLLPLESQGTVLGFLALQHSRDRYWQSEELALLELVRAQLSTAIIQSQRFRQVQSLVEERTAQLRRSLEVQAKLYEKTRRQIDQLRHLNQLKDEFLSNMSHELRTPLTSINLAVRMLRQPGLSAERQTKYLDILEQQCNQEIKLVNDLLSLQQLESQQAPLLLQSIDLKPRIQDLARSFEEKWAHRGLTIAVDLPKPLLLQTDADSLERILQELLTNAGKYSDLNTHVILKATHQVDREVNQIVLALTNLGPGLSPEAMNHIFDKFRRGEGVTQQAIQGTGLGLALVKCLVQHLNGTIVVSSHPVAEDSMTSEICFTVTLPQVLDHTQP